MFFFSIFFLISLYSSLYTSLQFTIITELKKQSIIKMSIVSLIILKVYKNIKEKLELCVKHTKVMFIKLR